MIRGRKNSTLAAMVATWPCLFGACQAAGGGSVGSEPASEPRTDVGELRATKDGSTWLRFRAVPDPVPVNEPFELEVRLYADSVGEVPVEAAQLFVRGYMPDHGHGMIREPAAEEVAPGVYRVRGMLFHMVGFWQLSFDVIRDGLASSIDYEVEL
jgi:hypothetical protein